MKENDPITELTKSVTSTTQLATLSGKLFNTAVTKEEIATCNNLFNEKKYQECYDFAKQLLIKNPNSRVSKMFLAKAAAQLDKFDLAFAILLTELQKTPDNANICDILATTYRLVNQHDVALDYSKRAITYSPDDPAVHNNLALIYFDAGLFDDALYHYQQAIELGDLPMAHLGFGLTLLAMRRYQEGWAAYESRFRMPGNNTRPIKLAIPFWDKTAPLAGKKLMITWEQGIGDNIQFLRFIALLKQRHNPKIFISCGNSIAKLCKTIPNIEDVYAGKYIIFSDMDYQINMLSLPYMLDIYDENQFLTAPYIKADPMLVDKWRAQMGHDNSFRIGICWRGRPYYNNSAKRDCPLDYFLQLLAHPKLTLISLQRDLSETETDILHYSDIDNIGDTVTDLTDTAAVIASLDLVISVDTAIAHLAGAMGKPVWSVIRYETEWRHPRDRDISPWYPSMRLIRQAKPGDWDSVFQAVHQALADMGYTQLTDDT